MLTLPPLIGQAPITKPDIRSKIHVNYRMIYIKVRTRPFSPTHPTHPTHPPEFPDPIKPTNLKNHAQILGIYSFR
jgi:hypothetical protein